VPITNPVYDIHSDELIARLTYGTTQTGIRSNPDDYSFPVYLVDNNTPTYNVPCSGICKIIYADESTLRVNPMPNVPIPEYAIPSSGNDAQLIIINVDTGDEYDFYEVELTSGGWQVTNGSKYNVFWDGTPISYPSRGAGVPYFAGLIRPWEILQGHIDHAIALVKKYPRSGLCVYPASKTDGSGTNIYDMPQGARLQLDPTLTDAYFQSIGLSQTGIIIAHALQQYGMVLIDSGGLKIIVENLGDNPYYDGVMSWLDPELNLTDRSIYAIPASQYSVIALPDAYWNGGVPNYGNCYR